MLIGAHISTAGGYKKMADYAAEVGCECAQIFAKSPRQWNAKPLADDAIADMAELRAAGRLGPIFTHTSYLINITTTNEELYEKSIHALADELTRGSQLRAEGVNTHMGSVPDGDIDAAIRRATVAIERAFELAGGAENVHTTLLLENTAGAGTIFGGNVSDISRVITGANIPREKLGVTIDTCHAWAYGYDVAHLEGLEEIMSELEPIGLDRWMLVHANDCNFARGSRKDRHAWVGQGEIGEEGFRNLLHIKELDHLCLTTEMPGEVPQKDIINIDYLKSLRDE